MPEQRLLFDPSELPLDFKPDDILPKLEANFLPELGQSNDNLDQEENKELDAFDD